MKKMLADKAFRIVLSLALAVLVLTPDPVQADFELQLLHASDQEGNAEAIGFAPNFAALIDYFGKTHTNTLVLMSGDMWIPGTLLNAGGTKAVQPALREALGNGNARVGAAHVDVAIANICGVRAAAFGNHEFDKGTRFVADALAPKIKDKDGDGVLDTAAWLGPDFPFLAANLDFSGDAGLSGLVADGLLRSTAFSGSLADLGAAAKVPKIASSTLVEVNGETIGVVGATTPMLEQLSSPGDTTVKAPGAGTRSMADLATILQPRIDEVLAAGADKVILLSHMQRLSLEEELVGYLSGVDIVVAGGSDTLLADDEDVARGLHGGDTPAGTYPVVTANADGDTALVVNTDGQYRYVGRLVVTFDDKGRVRAGSVDKDVSGAFATTDEQVEALWGDLDRPFAQGTRGARARLLTSAVRDVVLREDAETWGWTDVFLNGERVAVRTEQTNLGVLSSWANLYAARMVDPGVTISLKNGGGIRASIGEIVATGTDSYGEVPPQANTLSGKQAGQVSTLDIANSLSFNNPLTLVTLTASDLMQVLEHGVAATREGASPGRFPQVAGLAFSFDPARPASSRIRSVALVDENGAVTEKIARDGKLLVDADKTYRMVTLSYLTTGGDGYPLDSLGSDIQDLGTTEQEAMKRCMVERNGTRETAYAVKETGARDDELIQNLSVRTRDTVLELGKDGS